MGYASSISVCAFSSNPGDVAMEKVTSSFAIGTDGGYLVNADDALSYKYSQRQKMMHDFGSNLFLIWSSKPEPRTEISTATCAVDCTLFGMANESPGLRAEARAAACPAPRARARG